MKPTDPLGPDVHTFAIMGKIMMVMASTQGYGCVEVGQDVTIQFQKPTISGRNLVI